jgi:thioester reductase-like protein
MDAVYHVGALVQWSVPYGVLLKPNVLGTAEVVRLASMAPSPLPIHHVSTYEVSHYQNGYMDEDTPLPSEPPPDPRPYIWSKWAAEKVLTQAQLRGFPISVYRPALISGSSETGGSNTDDYYISLLKGSIQLGSYPSWEGSMAITPVNKVAKAMVVISRTPGTLGKVYNMIPQRALSFKRYFETAQEFGLGPMAVLPHAEWLTKLTAAGQTNVLAQLLFMLQTPRTTQYTGSLLKRHNTEAVLGDSLDMSVSPADLLCIFSYLTAIKYLPASHQLQLTAADHFNKHTAWKNGTLQAIRRIIVIQ